MDCREIKFSPEHSNKRIEKAKQTFDQKLLLRILVFALHLFGAKRQSISSLTGMPEESVKTALRVLLRDGFQAFIDRRKSKMISIPKISTNTKRVTIRIEGDWIIIDFDSNEENLRIPSADKIQVRTVLLSLMNSDMLSTQEVASVLEISDAHCRKLAKKLECDDVEESLIDKRRGQMYDFRFGPVQKAEIIQQFAARTVTGQSISSEVLTELVNKQTYSNLSPRTVRWHINKLGLLQIKTSLPELVDTLKKKS